MLITYFVMTAAAGALKGAVVGVRKLRAAKDNEKQRTYPHAGLYTAEEIVNLPPEMLNLMKRASARAEMAEMQKKYAERRA